MPSLVDLPAAETPGRLVLVVDEGVWYVDTGSAWDDAPQEGLTGPPGADGADGDPGAPGADATAIYGDPVTINKGGTGETTAAAAFGALKQNASDTATGVVELATAAETTTGTDAARAVTPDGLAGSDFGLRVVELLVSDPTGAAIAVGDGKAYFLVPQFLNGYNLVRVAAGLVVASSSGIPTLQLANVTDGVDMLSTKLTIDASELTSYTAAAAAVIDTSKDDVATGDLLRVDVDVAGTGAKGLIVVLGFQLP